jgi:hypothetical protein
MQGNGGRCTHVHVGAMTVALQAAEATLPVGRTGAGGAWTTSDVVPTCANHVDDGCVADLVRGGCNPAAAAAIVVNLGWVMVDAAAELVGGGEGGGGTTMGGRGGGIKGGQKIIAVVVVDVNSNSGGADGGRVEGGRVEDRRRQRWTAMRFLLLGGEGGRKCSH